MQVEAGAPRPAVEVRERLPHRAAPALAPGDQAVVAGGSAREVHAVVVREIEERLAGCDGPPAAGAHVARQPHAVVKSPAHLALQPCAIERRARFGRPRLAQLAPTGPGKVREIQGLIYFGTSRASSFTDKRLYARGFRKNFACFFVRLSIAIGLSLMGLALLAFWLRSVGLEGGDEVVERRRRLVLSHGGMPCGRGNK